MSDPLVSVVMPVHNGMRYIDEALDSIFGQSYRRIEVILVDDGSTDGTADHVAGRAGARLRLIRRNSCSGLPAIARNEGMREAQGEFLAFIDADDAWAPDKLSCQVAAMRDRPDWGLSHTFCQVIDKDGRPMYIRRESDMPREEDGFHRLLQSCHITMSSVMIPRRTYERVGGLCESASLECGEDAEWYLRIASQYRIGFVPQVLVRYRKYASSVSGEGLQHQVRNVRGGLAVYRAMMNWADRGSAIKMRHAAAVMASDCARRFALAGRHSDSLKMMRTAVSNHFASRTIWKESAGTLCVILLSPWRSSAAG